MPQPVEFFTVPGFSLRSCIVVGMSGEDLRIKVFLFGFGYARTEAS
jgi:hypothetical protein